MRGPDYEGAFLDSAQRERGNKKPDDPTSIIQGALPDKAVGTSHVPDVGRVTLKNLWGHPDTHPLVLDLLLIRKYGPEWMLWSPETFEVLLPRDFGVQVSDLNLQKIHACTTLHGTQSFWEQWEIFLPCAMAFNGEFPDFAVMQVPTVAQCLVAADVATRIRTDVPWSDEMKKFLGVVHLHDGILVTQAPLEFVHVEAPDLGASLDHVREEWPRVRAAGVAPTKDTLEDEQLRRLLGAYEFLEESRSRLRYQLGLITNA